MRKGKHVLILVIGVEILEAEIQIILIYIVIRNNNILRIAISHRVLSVHIFIFITFFIYIIKPLESLVLDYRVACRSLDGGLEVTKI